MNLHSNLWNKFWNNFNVEINESSSSSSSSQSLEKIIHSSLYYLMSALPSAYATNQKADIFYGISPTGLGKGGTNLSEYEGHTMWDTEIWMQPVFNIINSNLSKTLLNYRFRKLKVAQNFAYQTGYKGAR